MKEEKINCQVLYAIIMQLFGKYPYLPSWVSLNELSRETNISSKVLEKFLKDLQREALKKELKKIKRWEEEIEIFDEKLFI